MNKKGFTLIELIGSIVIIAALALIAFPAILSLLNSGQKQVDNNVIKFMESAALDYVNENSENNPTGCTLVRDGYISTTFYKKYSKEIDNHRFICSKGESKTTCTYEEGGGAENCLN